MLSGIPWRSHRICNIPIWGPPDSLPGATCSLPAWRPLKGRRDACSLNFLLKKFAEVVLHIWKLQTSALASSFLPASSMPARPLPAGAEAAGKRPAAGGGAASPARLHLHAPACRVTGRRRRIRRGAAGGRRRRRQSRSWRLQGPAQQGARLRFALSLAAVRACTCTCKHGPLLVTHPSLRSGGSISAITVPAGTAHIWQPAVFSSA